MTYTVLSYTFALCYANTAELLNLPILTQNESLLRHDLKYDANTSSFLSLA